MPTIQTVEDAVDVAERFLSRYHAFRRLEKVVQEKDAWLTEFDVGILKKEIVRIRLHAATGQVIEYTKV